jgi:hypothetical protein
MHKVCWWLASFRWVPWGLRRFQAGEQVLTLDRHSARRCASSTQLCSSSHGARNARRQKVAATLRPLKQPPLPLAARKYHLTLAGWVGRVTMLASSSSQLDTLLCSLCPSLPAALLQPCSSRAWPSWAWVPLRSPLSHTRAFFPIYGVPGMLTSRLQKTCCTHQSDYTER